MDAVSIGYKLLEDSLEEPSRAYEHDGGFDVQSTIDCILEPFERKTIPCGLALELPPGYAALVVPRSGLAARQGLSIVNAPGLIDSGYRGEICVIAINLDAHEPIQIHHGDRIAQIVIIKLPEVKLRPVDTLGSSDRSNSGFGSSGI